MRAGNTTLACEVLFGSPHVREQEIVDGLAERGSAAVAQQAMGICDKARALRQKAAQGRAQHWDWECTPGTRIEPDIQEPPAGSLGEIVEVPGAEAAGVAAAQDRVRPPSGWDPYPPADAEAGQSQLQQGGDGTWTGA